MPGTAFHQIPDFRLTIYAPCLSLINSDGHQEQLHQLHRQEKTASPYQHSHLGSSIRHGLKFVSLKSEWQ